jgi:CheY-like chemotaxis protein
LTPPGVADTLKGEMSKTVLIVERDLALMRSLRELLEHRGFGVEETTDGKGAPELIRRSRPDCVVLAVDLDAGQNGYIICKKLKSEADLKTVPVIIIGDPKGFEKHQQLKTRAEDYLGKPFAAPALVDHVGGLVGFPTPLPAAAPAADAFEPALMSPEELALDGGGGDISVVGLDPDFEMVDSMFDDRGHTAPEPAASPAPEDSIPISTDSSELDMLGERTVVMSPPSQVLREARQAFQSSPSALGDSAAEARELRARVTELTGALEESRAHAGELDGRLRDLESELENRKTELEAIRSAPGKAESKEVFALRDAANKKDKEILRLKGELNAKEQEIVELREKENALEQQLSESTSELARKDAQLKTTLGRAEQLTQERKRHDQQLVAAREEARSSSARHSSLQTDYDALQARLGEIEALLEPSQRGHQEAESARAVAETALAETRGELEATRSQLDLHLRELDVLHGEHEQARTELDAARTQLAAQSSSFADEISGLRQRLAETEAGLKRHEERSQRRDARLRAQQERLEQVKATLQQAAQALEATPRESEDVELDDLAEA